MKELFLPFRLALLAKEKGFDEECFVYYTPAKRWMLENEVWQKHITNGFILKTVSDPFGDILRRKDTFARNSKFTKAISNFTAPLYQQITNWFRNNHQIDLHMNWSGRSCDGYDYWNCKIYKSISGLESHINKTHYYDYEQINGVKVGGQMVPHFENLKYYECLDRAIEHAFTLI